MTAKEGKKTGKPVTDGIRSKKKKEEQVQNWSTQTLKSGGIGCKSQSWQFQEYEQFGQLTV